jgi:hypothetical protein
MVKPAAGCRPLAYSSPEAVQTTGTVADITGPLKHPSIRPEVGELAVRGGTAAALAVLLPPLAILPTIEFGQDESRECASRISAVRPSERAKAAPARAAQVPARQRRR